MIVLIGRQIDLYRSLNRAFQSHSRRANTSDIAHRCTRALSR